MRYDHLSDDEVLSTVTGLSGNERGVVTSVIALIREVEDRRLERREAYSSIYDFCFRALRLSEGESRRRVNVARLSKRCPQVFDALASGAVNLTNLDLLRDVMTPESAEELIDAATGKTKFEVEVLVASLAPKPDVPSHISPLSEKEKAAGGKQQGAPLKPLSPGRYRIQMTGDEELRTLLERAQQLTRHANPSGDIAVVFKAALQMLVPKLEKEKLGKGTAPRASKGPQDPSDVSAAARREVFARDGEQCTYLSPTGERCPARAWLELDHRDARVRGGEGTPENLRVLCAAHNQYEAERAFGRAHVEKKIAARRAAAAEAHALEADRAWAREPTVSTNVERPQDRSLLPSASSDLHVERPQDRSALIASNLEIFEGDARPKISAATSPRHATLRSALVRLGFRAKEVDRVMALLPDESWTRPIEELLREAIAKLTS